MRERYAANVIKKVNNRPFFNTFFEHFVLCSIVLFCKNSRLVVFKYLIFNVLVIRLSLIKR